MARSGRKWARQSKHRWLEAARSLAHWRNEKPEVLEGAGLEREGMKERLKEQQSDLLGK